MPSNIYDLLIKDEQCNNTSDRSQTSQQTGFSEAGPSKVSSAFDRVIANDQENTEGVSTAVSISPALTQTSHSTADSNQSRKSGDFADEIQKTLREQTEIFSRIPSDGSES
jgi:hypothetical protein